MNIQQRKYIFVRANFYIITLIFNDKNKLSILKNEILFQSKIYITNSYDNIRLFPQ